MKRAFTATTLSILLFMVIVFGCRSGVDTSKPETQKQFGVRMAKMNLWREAMFRFKRAVDMKPEDATAHNNLAVAYEANGDFENALKEYREALRLDRTNQYIQKNYSRLVEFTTRAKKGPRTPGTPATTTTTGATPTSTTGLPGRPPQQPTDTRAPEPLMPPQPTDTMVTAPPPPGDFQ